MMTVINPGFAANPLEEAIIQFEHWRATRNKRGPIPDELRAVIRSLDTQYSHTSIAKALRINSTQLKSCLSPSNNKPTLQSMTLMECPSRTILSTTEHQGATLMFCCKNGKPVTINGLRGGDISAAISSLMRG